MRRLLILAFLLICCFATIAVADDQPAPAVAISMSDHGDPVLKAMMAELKRSQEKLQLGQLHKQICHAKGRVEIHEGDNCCVLISKAELDALEEALEILSNTSQVQKVEYDLRKKVDTDGATQQASSPFQPAGCRL